MLLCLLPNALQLCPSIILMLKVMYVIRVISLNADNMPAVLCLQTVSFISQSTAVVLISSQLSAKPLNRKVTTIHLQILSTGKY